MGIEFLDGDWFLCVSRSQPIVVGKFDHDQKCLCAIHVRLNAKILNIMDPKMCGTANTASPQTSQWENAPQSRSPETSSHVGQSPTYFVRKDDLITGESASVVHKGLACKKTKQIQLLSNKPHQNSHYMSKWNDYS